MMTRDTAIQVRNLSDNKHPATWHPNSQSGLTVQFYERDVEAEAKIFKLMFHTKATSYDSTKNTVYNRSRAPTDAEIIFGDCNCEYLFCNRECRYGWGKSRIDWLWELERRQQQLQRFQLIQNCSRPLPKRCKPPTDDLTNLAKKSKKATPKKRSYWRWFRLSCICASDTESCDFPYCKSTYV
ncbi:uncharacterized protein LOC26528281 [Drosophila mojavensis]|uniref:Uncharacterized protein n=1 Tax=Drosophila mojavensis TaxID=7230 RepID=A0A0Q9XC81_DROMO|nr:uncharacterized protein LOC26528281 [Drosophila mojavensis]KRG01395.1 uncharacterized protein Dmoj_GI26640 [Drosophila mojavensis]